MADEADEYIPSDAIDAAVHDIVSGKHPDRRYGRYGNIVSEGPATLEKIEPISSDFAAKAAANSVAYQENINRIEANLDAEGVRDLGRNFHDVGQALMTSQVLGTRVQLTAEQTEACKQVQDFFSGVRENVKTNNPGLDGADLNEAVKEELNHQYGINQAAVGPLGDLNTALGYYERGDLPTQKIDNTVGTAPGL